MSDTKNKAGIRNITEVPWQQFPNHFGGALSKPLVSPDNTDIKSIDYRISSYQPMAYVAAHTDKIPGVPHHATQRGNGIEDFGISPINVSIATMSPGFVSVYILSRI